MKKYFRKWIIFDKVIPRRSFMKHKSYQHLILMPNWFAACHLLDSVNAIKGRSNDE